MDHFANAFTLTPARCFRMVTLPGVRHPSHCEEPVAWHGRWRAADNRLYRVDACEGHGGQLAAPLHRLRPEAVGSRETGAVTQ
jgi:hypothetical protein